jgi:iduronate 2-sulfatase
MSYKRPFLMLPPSPKNLIFPFMKIFALPCCLLLILYLSGCQPNEPEGPQPPYNVLFIAVDDLRPEFGAYGATHIHSPHLDRLADQGMLFRRAYCNVPVCGASRASLMTGTRPTRHTFITYTARADHKPEMVTLPEHFRQNGYYTFSMGKVLHDFDDSEDSWDENWRVPDLQSWRDYVTEENLAIEREHERGYPFEIVDTTDEAYRDGKIAAHAIAKLQSHQAKDTAQPFFMAVGFLKPHLPFNAPKRYWDLYDPAEIDLPPAGFRPDNAPEEAFHKFGELRHYHGIPPQGFLSDSLARRLIHGYYACVSYADAQVGKVLDELERLDLDQNTIVVLWGDHGWNLREHGLWCKHCLFNTSVQVPLIIRAPGMPAGETRAITEFVDLFPTLCALNGLPQLDQLEGQDLVPILEDPSLPGDGLALSKWFDGLTLIDDQHFYTEWINDEDSVYARMLYDQRIDPEEMNNIVEAASPEQLERMSRQIREIRGPDFWKPRARGDQ